MYSHVNSMWFIFIIPTQYLSLSFLPHSVPTVPQVNIITPDSFFFSKHLFPTFSFSFPNHFVLTVQIKNSAELAFHL
jgi:hypothetical protein